MGKELHTNGGRIMRELVQEAWGQLRRELRGHELAGRWAAYDAVSERRDQLAAWWHGRTGVDLWAE
jgi:hypothetical protein